MIIKVDSSLKPALTVIENFEGSTFGDLKPLLIENGVYTDGMRVMVGNTHTTLEVDSAALPQEDELIIFISPRDTKAGSDLMDVVERITDAMNEVVEDDNNEVEVYTEPKTDEIVIHRGQLQKEIILAELENIAIKVEALVTTYNSL